MVRVLPLAVSCLLVAAVLAPAVDDPEPPSPSVDLAPKANRKSKDDYGTGRYTGNDLASLPTGLKTLAGVKFRVGASLFYLGTEKAKDQKVQGVKVGKAVGKLHFLHGTEHSAGEGVVVGKYVVHHAHKSTTEIEVAYGGDVVDWWAYANQAAPTVGKVAWEGQNVPAKGFDAKIRLYRMTWKNPNPKKKVAGIDFVATVAATTAVPFCVAITAEK